MPQGQGGLDYTCLQWWRFEGIQCCSVFGDLGEDVQVRWSWRSLSKGVIWTISQASVANDLLLQSMLLPGIKWNTYQWYGWVTETTREAEILREGMEGWAGNEVDTVNFRYEGKKTEA